MALSGFYPVLCSADVGAARDFYVGHFGFEVTFEADWYVSLRRADAHHFELALLDPSHPSVPADYRKPLQGGLLLNVEVDDVDAEHERLVRGAGLREVLPLRSEEFGQRHFIVAAPDGVLVDVITNIAPGEEYAANFVAEPGRS